ncbi:MAG: peptidylprolyl isomerase [Acidimicrobiales bacterium]|nr:peptidylprolyl isomerase [Acidimicrobiales bacterium]
MPPTRRIRLLALAVAALLAVTLVACGGDDDGGSSPTTSGQAAEGTAATVNGTEISAAQLQDELDAIVGNDAYVQSLESSGITVTDDQGELDPAFVTQVLDRQILLALVAAEVEAQGIEPSDSVVAASRDDVITGVGGQDVFDAFPESYQQQLVDWGATALALQLSFVDLDAVDDASLQAWYEANPDQFDEVCARHILVESEGEAQAALLELQNGADFAEVAAARSIDTGSAEQGGDLGCVGRGRLVPEFEDAAFAATPGEVVGPVQSQFGYHLIVVDEHKTRSLDDLGDELLPTILASSEQAFGEFVDGALTGADVQVDARYGTWNPTGDAGPRTDPPGTETTTTTTTAAPPTTTAG